jgi:hypothetical protein
MAAVIGTIRVQRLLLNDQMTALLGPSGRAGAAASAPHGRRSVDAHTGHF